MEINDALITQWEPQLHKMLQSYPSLGNYDYNDLAQELRIAIVKAAKHFDENRGVSFHTYLWMTLRNNLWVILGKTRKERQFLIKPSAGVAEEDALTAPVEETNPSAFSTSPNEFQDLEDAMYLRDLQLTDKEMLVAGLFIEGYNNLEMQRLGIKPKALTQIKQRIKEKILRLKNAG